MSERKIKTGLILVGLIAFSLVVPIFSLNSRYNTPIEKIEEDLRNSGTSEVTKTRQWIKNGNFSSSDYWTPVECLEGDGDPDDVDAYISDGKANFEIIGKTFRKEISDPINLANADKWTAFNKTEPTINPDTCEIDNNGFHVSHSWHDATADQVAKIYWRYNVSMGTDMSQYNITSATLNATMYANVDDNVDAYPDTQSETGDGERTLNQIGIYDHAYFFVEIADIDVEYPYRIAFNQTTDLGRNSGPLTYDQKTIEAYGDEQDLIYYLSKILEDDEDHDNFTIIVGIEINCEDDYTGQDYDDWTELRIKSLNLTFTYEKKINQFTTVSWNQEGDKPSDIITNDFIINEAILNFTYATNDTLPETLSPNSEIQILINGVPHSETIKLWTAETDFKNASVEGFDVRHLIEKDKNINVSIQVYLADEFDLNRTITFSIDDIYLNVTYTEDVTDIETKIRLFLDGTDKTGYPFISLPLGEELNITVKYTNLTGDYIPSAEVNLDGKVSGTLDPDPSFEQHNITINTEDLGIGTYLLTLIAQKTFYETNQTQFVVKVTERDASITEIFINRDNCTGNKTANVFSGEMVNITVQYIDNDAGGDLIHNAFVTLNGTGVGEIFEDNNNFYNLTFNSTDLDVGIFVLSIIAQKDNYSVVTEKITLNIYIRETEYWVYLNGTKFAQGETPSIEVHKFEFLNITFTYNDTILTEHIPGAIVDINGSGVSKVLEDKFNNYSVLINTTKLNQGVNFLTLFARKDGYEAHSILIVVEIIQIETNLTLFINGTDVTSNPSIERCPNQILNVTVSYNRSDPVGHIPGATVDINGSGISKVLEDKFNNYSVLINTTKLNQGAAFLSIFAQKVGYESQAITLIISIIQIETELTLYIDGVNETADHTIQRYIGQEVNVTVSYNRSDPVGHIPGATVDINGSGISKVLEDKFNNYSILINTTKLNQGANFLSIFARKDGYNPQAVILVIEIIQIETNLTLFVNGSDISSDPSIEQYPNQILNVTISYNTSNPISHIPGATVDINGSGISEVLPEAFDNYSVEIDTDDLNQGANFLSIFVRKDGYEPQAIILVIQIIQIETELTLFVDGVDITLDPSIEQYPGQNVNITISYNTSNPISHIPGATVDINSTAISEVLPEAFDNYSVEIDTDDLNQGANFLSIFARKEGYEPQSILLIIQIIPIDTDLQLFINSEDLTLNPDYNLTIGQSINLTVKYTDQNGVFIPNAAVSLERESTSLDLIKHDTLDQYYINLDTTELGLGKKFYTIILQKPNYQSITKEVTITVKQIYVEIRTVSGIAQIEAEIGDNVVLQVILNDTIFDMDITNATILYDSPYYQGELEYSNNGIYEDTLENVRDGVHTITINAYAGDYYDFESYTITLFVTTPTVSPGPDLSWLIYVLVFGIVGLVSFFAVYQMYLKYPPMVRKIRKLKKNVKKSKRTKPIAVDKRDEIIGKELQNQIKDVEYEMIQIEELDKVEKVIKKEGGEN
ncbi:MAG: hypothetical protein ACFFC3_01215 [Candidatus Odinarchaeota archaeon]